MRAEREAMLLMLALAAPTAVQMMATARTMVAAPHCATAAAADEVTVCGRRRADRFRVPFVVHDPGDPAHEPAAVERDRLIRRTTPIQDMSPFLVGGGMAGVHATAGGGGGLRTGGLRELAP